MENNLDMVNEDEMSESDEDDHVPIFTSELAKLKEKELGKSMKNMDPDAGEDEDIGMEIDNNDGHPDEFSESSEDKDDYNIRKTDSLIVTATTKDDPSNL